MIFIWFFIQCCWQKCLVLWTKIIIKPDPYGFKRTSLESICWYGNKVGAHNKSDQRRKTNHRRWKGLCFYFAKNNIAQAWDIGKYLEMVKAREREIYRSNHCEKQLYRIISTALENSSKTPHWWSSVRMLQTSPDFFNFILGILWSHLEVAANVAVIISIANNHILVSVYKQI